MHDMPASAPPTSADSEQALLTYTQEMHQYTLQLWTEVRKQTEEREAAADAGRRCLYQKQPKIQQK